MDKGTKIYIVWIVILLFLFIAVIFWCIGNMGANNNSSVSNNQPTTTSKNIYSSNINSVRLATLHEYPTLRIGDLLENYQYFKSFEWKEFTTKQGEHIISFTADYYAKITEYKEEEKYRSYEAQIEIQFATYTNNSYFKLKQIIFSNCKAERRRLAWYYDGNKMQQKYKTEAYKKNTKIGGSYVFDDLYNNEPIFLTDFSFLSFTKEWQQIQ